MKNINAGDIVSYKGIEDSVEEVLDNEVRIQNQDWDCYLDDEVSFWIWVNIKDLD